MRPWSLVLLLSTTSPALAQEAPAEPPASAPAAPASTPAPAPAAEKPPRPRAASPAPAPSPASAEDEGTRQSIRDDAQFVINYLLTGDVRGTVSMIAFPFQLEERRFDTPEPLVATWVKQLRDKRTDLITLYDIEVLPYADFEKKYGKPPARLGAIVPRGVEVYAAVANLSGHAAILLYRPSLDGWRAFAYTD
ncbi:hypothetical protein [Melittangium boletus]|uniref:Uncharacterized protein n=1 Tax=Melittangium boletus DSM 14713 TaxID=1294270 RepID=A0A250ITG2_9BACT|nr:hypothetical protein [Melittangium boletus]ATB34216.1 hypothetical protein MEBOL_007717 [Melittangium boletus DSM 14713]